MSSFFPRPHGYDLKERATSLLDPQLEILGQSGFLFNFLRTHDYALLLTISCFLGPLSSQIRFQDMAFMHGKEPTSPNKAK